MDTYSMQVGYSVPGVVTGKPIVIGGSLGGGSYRSRCGVLCAGSLRPAEDAIQGRALWYKGLAMWAL